MAAPTKHPIWMRAVFAMARKLGIAVIINRGDPDNKWMVVLQKRRAE